MAVPSRRLCGAMNPAKAMSSDIDPGALEQLAPYGARTLDAMFYTASVAFIAATFVPALRDSTALVWAVALSAVVIGVVWEVR